MTQNTGTDDGETQLLENTDDDTEDFRYHSSLARSIPPKIRLLTLRPNRPNSDSNRIECTIADYDFDEHCPEYDTLSYVWGDSSVKTSILCNGKIFHVTTQLARALCALRRTDDRHVWIDQLCINQADDVEKTEQVGMMSQIYRRSANTVAWLDDQSGDMKQGFESISRIKSTFENDPDPETLQKLAAEVERYEEQQNLPVSQVARLPIDMKIIQLRYGALSWSDVSSIAKIIDNAWFSRRWIVQEATLCSNLIMMNGKIDSNNECQNLLSCSFESLLRAFALCTLQLLEQRYQLIRIDPMRRLGTSAFIRFRYLDSPILDFDLIQLLVMCRFFHNSDPRDRLFSLCGFTSDRAESDPARLEPDYVTPAAEVLATSIYKLMKSENNLRLLEMAESSERYHGIPSWVPYDRSIKDPERLNYGDLIQLDMQDDSDTMLRMFGISDDEKDDDDDDDDNNEDNNSAENEDEDNYDSSYEENNDGSEGDLDGNDKSYPSSEATSSASNMAMLELEDGLVLQLRGRVIDRIVSVGPVVLMPAAKLGTGFGQADPNDYQRGLEEIQRQSEARLQRHWMFYCVELFRILVDILGLATSILHRYPHVIAETDAMVLKRKENFVYPTGEDLMTVYRKTLCGGTDTPRNLITVEESERAFYRWRRAHIGPQSVLNKVRSFFGASQKVGGFLGAIVTIVSSLMAFVMNDRFMLIYKTGIDIYGRRMAWTEDGLLALVPSRCAVGDCVIALDGAKVPFVLSQIGQDWEMRGPTYIHGLMDSPRLRENLDQDIRIV